MGTLLVTQFREIIRNSMIVVFWGIMIAIALMMRFAMPEEAVPILATVLIAMPPYFVAWQIPAMTLADEQEKRALQALVVTPLGLGKLLTVKALLGVTISLVFSVLVVAILGQPVNPALFFLGTLLLSLFTVSCGTLVGLLVKDVKQLGTFGTPVLLALMFASTLPWQQFRPAVWAAQAFLPTRPSMELMLSGLFGTEVPVLQNSLVLLLYTGLVLALVAWRARRMGLAAK